MDEDGAWNKAKMIITTTNTKKKTKTKTKTKNQNSVTFVEPKKGGSLNSAWRVFGFMCGRYVEEVGCELNVDRVMTYHVLPCTQLADMLRGLLQNLTSLQGLRLAT